MMQLVLVEDEYIQLEEYRTLCEQYLQGEQYKITCYVNAEGLQEHMKLGKPIDILIMDIRLSNANGIELAKQVKRVYPHTAVIFISAYLEYAPFVYEVDHVYFIYKKTPYIAFLKRWQKPLSIITIKSATYCRSIGKKKLSY